MQCQISDSCNWRYCTKDYVCRAAEKVLNTPLLKSPIPAVIEDKGRRFLRWCNMRGLDATVLLPVREPRSLECLCQYPILIDSKGEQRYVV